MSMSNRDKSKDGKSELQRRMEQIQLDKQRKTAPAEAGTGSSEQLRRLRTVIDKVVKDFVEADSALILQWSGNNQYFVSLSHIHVLVISMTTTPSTLHVDLSTEDMFRQHYEWTADESEAVIKSAVADGLLEWYKRWF
ncbi:hypothetical protein [Alicyclobacillus mengziensis]|uniref:Uncharacterized protein n=1 Tax=Alicyclobacillus mengziensis TaxID=2931921 RepID=A0A9X7Z6Z8_9BACL|nr:hypothetical protein [Alicyclobacillus mengziensis]QSO47867.1 hypothetical protein JZ786_02155 [Alicyclobacillus mengziensis]